MKYLKIIAVLLILAFVIAQFFRPDRTLPPIVETEAIALPENIRQVLAVSCYDCHSNNTRYPWYSNISPISWWLQDHIEQGRSQLNFSVWNTYDTRKKERKLEEICEQIEMDAMPLPSYLWIHRDAVLTRENAKTLCDWATTEKKKLEETKF